MKRSAKTAWWCSLAFTLFMLGSMIIPSFFPDRGWGNWTPFVALEKPCGEVKRFDWHAPFDGGAGTTWFLFRAGEDWKQGCIRRFGLKESSPDSFLEKSLRQAGALEKWNDPVDFSGWAVFESSPFLWKEGMQPRREGQVFHHRVSLFLEPEGNHCLLALDRSVAERDDLVPAWDIAEGEGTWGGKIREYMPEWFLSAFSLGVAGLCVLAPCMLVWIPVPACDGFGGHDRHAESSRCPSELRKKSGVPWPCRRSHSRSGRLKRGWFYSRFAGHPGPWR